MNPKFKLTAQDITIKQENVLELFYSGIKSQSTKETLQRLLRYFLVDVCADLLQGDFEERAEQFVTLASRDQTKATNIIIAYVKKLRERTSLDKSDPYYMNPSYLPNKIKPIKKLLTMNDVGLAWKRVYTFYPEKNNTHQGRGYTKKEIKKLLEYSTRIDTEFIILASSSGGMRLGAWNDQRWENVFPIYEVDGKYKIELKDGEKGNVVCAGMIIYKKTPEQYTALISIEAWEKLQEYKKVWTKKMSRVPTGSDHLLLNRVSSQKPVGSKTIKKRISDLLLTSGLRGPLTEGKRRHEVPTTHGFRRYWDKVMMQTESTKGTLSALVIKERLLGHYGLVKTDKNYFWTDILEHVPEYLEAMPELMINEEYRLSEKLKKKTMEGFILENELKKKDMLLQRMAELEAKVSRMQNYKIK
ncbi:integrase family protein [Marine Group I thaumarchaeote SCGC AAA799-E16]|uniref:Integrase family protein n=4 Tax=Marine Group I TaxID=905826 RepID=A0A087S8S9_9ARCH|nr:integrase family protein [Marine Group I thaumarchaeote SCGC AAA799-E16]KFM17354.1 integrase family protein [Marine Group I thaumarchaeote SCGC AAA799-D11]KFM19373.1 integrase family protein [Marine Group I thaumarchaeote SCGC RSA3]KFM22133.1 integrase family protein [Marine Group I thaumarchaeote SCGC AAA799-B03]